MGTIPCGIVRRKLVRNSTPEDGCDGIRLNVSEKGRDGEEGREEGTRG